MGVTRPRPFMPLEWLSFFIDMRRAISSLFGQVLIFGKYASQRRGACDRSPRPGLQHAPAGPTAGPFTLDGSVAVAARGGPAGG